MNTNLNIQANFLNPEAGSPVYDSIHDITNYKTGSGILDASQALHAISTIEKNTRISSFSRFSDWGLNDATLTIQDVVKVIPTDSTTRVESYAVSLPLFENPTIAGNRQSGTLEVTGAADSSARAEFTFNNYNGIWRRYITTSLPTSDPQADSGWLMMSSRGAQVEITAAMSSNLGGLLSNLKTPGEYTINSTILRTFTDNPFSAFGVSPVLSFFHVERSMRNRGVVQTCSSLINNAEFRRYILADGTVGQWAMVATSGREFLSDAAMNFAGGVLSGHLSPNVTASRNLGGSTRTWNNIYIQNAPVVVSDKTTKTDINIVNDIVLDAWGKVDFCEFKRISEVASENSGGEKATIHIGVIAQKIDEAFSSVGLKATDYGLVSHYTTEEDSNGIWMVRMEECLALEAALMRREMNRLKESVLSLSRK